MRMSSEGVEMLSDFELELEYIKAMGLGEFDDQGNLVGIYPYYVMRRNATTGILESDGGITVGYSFWISQAVYNQNDIARDIINRYASGASFIPSHTNNAHRVPNSLLMPINEARDLLSNTLPKFEAAVNSFLLEHRVLVEQHQFDALVSFTYNFGENTWTLPDRADWHIRQLIINGPPFIPGDTEKPEPGTVRYVFASFAQNQGRRSAEAEIFIYGHGWWKPELN